MQVYRRFAIFQAIEYHVRQDGEWFRDDDRSSISVAAQVNKFTETESAEIVFASPPDMKLIGRDDDTRVYQVSVSVVYVPSELIVGYDQEKEGGTANASREIERRSIALPETPEEIYKILGQSIGDKLAVGNQPKK